MAASQEAAPEPTPDRGDTVALSKHPGLGRHLLVDGLGIADQPCRTKVALRMLLSR
jgi:hypothetical protein